MNPRVDAELRRFSARASKTLAERFGSRLGIWFGAGYPRSGTTYLCQLMASYLDLPLIANYRLPALMPCVIHSHWLPGKRLPPTIYVVRDGRDVIVSRYFFELRSVTEARNPRGAARRRARFRRLYGEHADLQDVRARLPRFIEAEMTEPQLTGVNWPTHVGTWLALPSDRVAVVRYEAMRADVAAELGPAFEQLTGRPVDKEYLQLAGQRFDFAWQQRRNSEAGARVTRDGKDGDWHSYFSDESIERFAHHAGGELARLGYSTSD